MCENDYHKFRISEWWCPPGSQEEEGSKESHPGCFYGAWGITMASLLSFFN